MSALVRLSSTPQLATRSWRVRKVNLFPLAEGGACILKRRCLQRQAMVVAALSPLTLSLSLSLSLLRSLSLLPSLPALLTALLTAPGPVIIFHLLVFIFFRLFSGALRGKR